MPETRRLFIKGMTAIAVAAAIGAGLGPSKVYTLNPEEIENGETVARVPHMLRYLDEAGAVYSSVPGMTGYYQAEWSDPDLSDLPITWMASVETNDFDWMFARAFRAKVEGWDKF